MSGSLSLIRSLLGQSSRRYRHHYLSTVSISRINYYAMFSHATRHHTMKEKVVDWTLRHPRAIAFVALLILMISIGAVGEVAASNPAGIEVPVCEHGHPAHEVASGPNPNCHH